MNNNYLFRIKNILNFLIVLFFLSTTSLFASDDHYTALAKKAQFIERMNGNATNKLIRKYPSEYLFIREDYCNCCSQDNDLSDKVYDRIDNQKPDYIHFNSSLLHHFDQGGVCSAMALDFLARYKTEVENIEDPLDRIAIVQEQRPYYRMDNDVFISRQAAYNTIEVDAEMAVQDAELIKHQKMQSLASYHDLTLIPVTDSIAILDVLYNQTDLVSLINNLPDDTYLIRALCPCDDNQKLEYFGHTMVFIKNKDLSIYFDNSKGAENITHFEGEAVKETLEDWSIPEFRIYRATAPEQGCSNLSDLETDNSYCEHRFDDGKNTFPGVATREFVEGSPSYWLLSVYDGNKQFTQKFPSFPLHSGCPEIEDDIGTTAFASCDYIRDQQGDIHSYGLMYVFDLNKLEILKDNRDEIYFKEDLDQFFYFSGMDQLQWPYYFSYQILNSNDHLEEIVFVAHDDLDESYNSQVYWIRIHYFEDRAVILVHSILVNRPGSNYDVLKELTEDWSFHNGLIIN